jgi:hypothetical protein
MNIKKIFSRNKMKPILKARVPTEVKRLAKEFQSEYIQSNTDEMQEIDRSKINIPRINYQNYHFKHIYGKGWYYAKV